MSSQIFFLQGSSKVINDKYTEIRVISILASRLSYPPPPDLLPASLPVFLTLVCTNAVGHWIEMV